MTGNQLVFECVSASLEPGGDLAAPCGGAVLLQQLWLQRALCVPSSCAVGASVPWHSVPAAWRPRALLLSLCSGRVWPASPRQQPSACDALRQLLPTELAHSPPTEKCKRPQTTGSNQSLTNQLITTHSTFHQQSTASVQDCKSKTARQHK